jgi:siroheme synthase (precorrin-2 oxidase/ferrochelatase)
VCAATDCPEINTQIFKEAAEVYGVKLINVVDVIPECTFAAASVVTCDGATLSVSTGGKSPAMAKRIREYLETRLGAASLYTTASLSDGRVLPYAVYFLLENRRCVLVKSSREMNGALAQRAALMRHCGGCVEFVDAPLTPGKTVAVSSSSEGTRGRGGEGARERGKTVAVGSGSSSLFTPNSELSFLPTANCYLLPGGQLSDAFLVCYESVQRATRDVNVLTECLDAPEQGSFVTPSLVQDGDLIIGVYADDSQNPSGQKIASQLQAMLAEQFEHQGYGDFIDFLASLRPIVLSAIPDQKVRQRFFESLIDEIPENVGVIHESPLQRCCLGFGNPGCAVACVLNLVRNREMEQAYRLAHARLNKLMNV